VGLPAQHVWRFDQAMILSATSDLSTTIELLVIGTFYVYLVLVTLSVTGKMQEGYKYNTCIYICHIVIENNVKKTKKQYFVGGIQYRLLVTRRKHCFSKQEKVKLFNIFKSAGLDF